MHDIQWWLSAFSLVRPWRASCHYVLRSPSSSAASTRLAHSAPAFALKAKQRVNRALPHNCQINTVYILCLKIRFSLVRSPFEKVKFLDAQAVRLRRLVLLPESFHYPAVSLKASAVWRRQISQICWTVWVKERLKCVFSGDRWAYYLPVCVFSLWPNNINSLCLFPVYDLSSELGQALTSQFLDVMYFFEYPKYRSLYWNDHVALTLCYLLCYVRKYIISVSWGESFTVIVCQYIFYSLFHPA